MLKPHSPLSAESTDRLLAFVSIGGLVASILPGLSVRGSTTDVSDFKTLYASSWCFLHGVNAYNVANIERVFWTQGIASPQTWFGHSPIYPPTTLALFAPFTLLPISLSAYCFVILSACLLALALASLFRYASDFFHLSLWGKVIIACVCASTPLVSFGLAIGNLSVACSALAILAFTRRRNEDTWLSSGALAAAFLLKPHLALWPAIGMAVLPNTNLRTIARQAGGIACTVVAAVFATLLLQGRFVMQLEGYSAIFKMETSRFGSMSVSSFEALPVVSQITSLQSLIGFWTSNRITVDCLTCLLIVFLACLLFRMTKSASTEAAASLAIGCWCAFGLLATYHRAHDGIILLLLLPILIHRLKIPRQTSVAAIILALFCALSIGPEMQTVARYASAQEAPKLVAFLLLRQSGLAITCLLTMLIVALKREPISNATGAIPAYQRTTIIPSYTFTRTVTPLPNLSSSGPLNRRSQSPGVQHG